MLHNVHIHSNIDRMQTRRTHGRYEEGPFKSNAPHH
jgi:hypothetical protein